MSFMHSCLPASNFL
uniref:Uncharacterized protein n=1 Tax=Anguilla anguilla TaxID=7936 RepID=A0A0E9P9E6_ANGAN